jgi:hypothetical protein
MQYAVVLGEREVTIDVEAVSAADHEHWEAHVADWETGCVLDDVVIGNTEQAAGFVAWLELVDRFGMPATHPPGVS